MGEEKNPEKEREGIPCFLLRDSNPYRVFDRYWKEYRPLRIFQLRNFLLHNRCNWNHPYWDIYKGKYKKKNHIKEAEEWKNYLLSKVKEHEKTLGIKRNQILRKNSYGHIDQKQRQEWTKELATFFMSIQFPSPSMFTPEEMREFYDIVDKISEEASNSLVFDAEKVTPKEYEAMCAEILKDAGWDASVTKTSGDQGVDVVAGKSGKKIVLQCIGNKTVQEVLAGKSFYGAHVAAVVSNQTFTSSAKELAQSTGVLLLHHEMLSDLDSMI